MSPCADSSLILGLILSENCDLVRVVDGKIKVGEVIRFMATGFEYEVTQLVSSPLSEKRSELSTGEVGFVCAPIKTIGHTKIGDTVTHADRPAATPLSGYAKVADGLQWYLSSK